MLHATHAITHSSQGKADVSKRRFILVKIPLIIPFLPLIVLFGRANYKEQKAKLERIAAMRQGDSICTFTRSFNYRNLDTWAIRSVHEYIQKSLENYYFCNNFPIRKEDSLGFLNLAEDIEDDWIEIAERIGRATDLDSVKQNPFSRKVDTVEKLVLFLVYQPKI